MSFRAGARLAACTATLCVVTVAPVATASASAGSIKAAFASYTPKIEIAEGHLVTAVGEYTASADPKDPSAVEAAIANSVSVLSALKGKIAAQPARKPRVRQARAKIVKGVQEVIVGYGELSVAYGEKAASQEAATVEAKAAVALVNRGRKQLKEGVRLLG